jgi:hypothetical protein
MMEASNSTLKLFWKKMLAGVGIRTEPVILLLMGICIKLKTSRYFKPFCLFDVQLITLITGILDKTIQIEQNCPDQKSE